MYSIVKIDELLINEHAHLTEEDDCFYLMEFIPVKHRIFNAENDVIMNFKKKVDRKGTSEWKYKGIAINKIANYMLESLPCPDKPNVLLIPIPPSKVKSDPLYDDRLIQLLTQYTEKCPNVEFREILSIVENMPAFHDSDHRPSPEEILKYFKVDKKLCTNDRDIVVLVDDVITSGCHYKACKMLLQPEFPNSNIQGLFIGRRNIIE